MQKVVSRPKSNVIDQHHAFLSLMPIIATHAKIAFRKLPPEAREECVQEVVANAFVAYARLVSLGKADLIYPTVLAYYAVAQTRYGRKVGGRLNAFDVTSEYGQMKSGVVVERLDQYDDAENMWQEIVVEDRRAGPAEIAATRIDFANYLRSLPEKLRKIAVILANGESNVALARKLNVTKSRVSQFRRALRECWDAFQGEEFQSPEAATVAA
jgi:hypothetical protein